MSRNLCGNPDCKTDLTHLRDPPRVPCPKCGATNRLFERSLHESLPPIKEQIKVRVKRQGRGKPLVESIGGDDLHRASGKWFKKERVIDQEKDYYRETITNPETGEIVHHQEHKLSEHRDHGTAKKKVP